MGNSKLKRTLKYNPGNTGQRFLFFSFVNSPFSSYTKTSDWKSIKFSFRLKKGKGAVSQSVRSSFSFAVCLSLDSMCSQLNYDFDSQSYPAESQKIN